MFPSRSYLCYSFSSLFISSPSIFISCAIIFVAGEASPYCFMNVVSALFLWACATSNHFAICLSDTFVGSFAISFSPLCALLHTLYMALFASFVKYYYQTRISFLSLALLFGSFIFTYFAFNASSPGGATRGTREPGGRRGGDFS